jgi:hypothetical protein
MKIINYIKKFQEDGKQFRNVLIFNVDIFDQNEIKEIGRNCQYVSFAFNNSFVASSFSAKLRFLKNIRFLNVSNVIRGFDRTSFDLIIMSVYDDELIKQFNENESVQYFVLLDNSKHINHVLFNEIEEGIYKRRTNSIVIDVSSDEEEYQKNLKRNNDLNELLNVGNNEKKHDQLNDQHTKKENFTVINVENLIPHQTFYNNFKQRCKVNDGVVALSMIISDEADFNKFQKCKDLILSQYSNIKYYIVLNGKETFKYLKNFNDVCFLIKSEIPIESEYYENVFNFIINNEYQFKVNKLQEEQFNDIWGLL